MQVPRQTAAESKHGAHASRTVPASRLPSCDAGTGLITLTPPPHASVTRARLAVALLLEMRGELRLLSQPAILECLASLRQHLQSTPKTAPDGGIACLGVAGRPDHGGVTARTDLQKE